MKKIGLLLLVLSSTLLLMSCKDREDPFLASHMSEILYRGIYEETGTNLNDIDILDMEAFKVYLEAIEDEKEMEATIVMLFITYQFQDDLRTSYIIAMSYRDNEITTFDVQYVDESRDQFDLDITYYKEVDIHQDPDVEVKTYETSAFTISKEEVEAYMTSSKVNLDEMLANRFLHEISILSDVGIEISIDGINYLTAITSDMMKSYASSFIEAWQLNHVSTFNGISFYRLYRDESIHVNEGYISFPLYIRSNEALSVYLDHLTLDSNIRSLIAEETFTDSKGYTIFKGSPFMYKLSDAMRVSFVHSVLNQDEVIIYENPFSDTNTYTGRLNNQNLHGSSGSLDYFFKILDAYPYLASSVSLPDTISTLDQTKISDLVLKDGYYQSMITINIWVEGWDNEAYEIFPSDSFKLEISISGR